MMRIKSKLGIGEAPPHMKGKHFFNLYIFDEDGETQIGDTIGPFGPFDTEREAIVACKAECRKACDLVAKAYGGKPTTDYLDMNEGGVVRKWEEH